MAQYWHRGESIDYTNTGTSTIRYGDVVPIGNRVGIAGFDIPANEVGSLHVAGVFIMPKALGAALPLGAGAFWDAATEAVTASGDVTAGWVIEPAASDAAEVKVKIG